MERKFQAVSLQLAMPARDELIHSTAAEIVENFPRH
jgi:hypothetical protein